MLHGLVAVNYVHGFFTMAVECAALPSEKAECFHEHGDCRFDRTF